MTPLPEATNWRESHPLATRMTEEGDRMTKEALLTLYGSIPRNRPEKYIDLEEIARRIGIKHESMVQNTSRTGWFPFTPAVTVSGKKRWYYRKVVEPWIQEKQWKKGISHAD